jgi:rhodanese-related sulfurtransferase
MEMDMRSLLLSGVAVLGVAAYFMWPSAGSADDIPFDEVRQRLSAGTITLIDVREPDEFAAGHVPGAVNMPMSTFNPAAMPASTPDKPVVVMCRSGNRSSQVEAFLANNGRADVRNFKGSMIEWTAKGAPVVR